MKYFIYNKFENLCWKLAKMIPARLKYYCFNLVLGHATTGIYSNQEITSMSWQTASQRFAKDYKL